MTYHIKSWLSSFFKAKTLYFLFFLKPIVVKYRFSSAFGHKYKQPRSIRPSTVTQLKSYSYVNFENGANIKYSLLCVIVMLIYERYVCRGVELTLIYIYLI
jgi:hypothetical protein